MPGFCDIHKVRPVALMETLIKCVEDIVVDRNIGKVRQRIQPEQQGLADDGVVTALRVLRGIVDEAPDGDGV